jgi:hypothetical protein
VLHGITVRGNGFPACPRRFAPGLFNRWPPNLGLGGSRHKEQTKSEQHVSRIHYQDLLDR